MLQRDMPVYHFWNENKTLFKDAWAEWDDGLSNREYPIDETIYDSALRDAVAKAWADPTTEIDVKNLWREVFPDIFGYDTQTFGFSIQWQPETDTALRAHTDASAVTLNINLNLPDESFEGSGVRFFDRESRQVCELSFAPGTALIHHGSVPHETVPITNGERSNFVLWLYGDDGQVPSYSAARKTISAHERWTTHAGNKYNFAPF